MSRKLAVASTRWSIALVAAALVLVPTLASAAINYSVGEVSGNPYEDAVLGAGHAEGDIWGGEQGTDPHIAPIGPVRGEDMPTIFTLPRTKTEPTPSPGNASWLYELGMMLDWLWTSLQFPRL